MISYPLRNIKIYFYLIVLGVPKTTLRTNKLLEGFADLNKAVTLMVTVRCSERMQIKIAWKRQSGKGETRYNMCKVLPTREAHPALGVQGFYRGQSCRHTMSM